MSRRATWTRSPSDGCGHTCTELRETQALAKDVLDKIFSFIADRGNLLFKSLFESDKSRSCAVA